MKGHPGTGKSTLAEAWVAQGDWTLVDKDDFKDVLLARRVADANELAYELLWYSTRALLDGGSSVVAVSPLSAERHYQAARSICERTGARLRVVECRLDEHHWRARNELPLDRAGDHRIRTWSSLTEYLRSTTGSWRGPLSDTERLIVDTATPLCDQIRRVTGFVSSQSEPDGSEAQSRGTRNTS